MILFCRASPSAGLVLWCEGSEDRHSMTTLVSTVAVGAHRLDPRVAHRRSTGTTGLHLLAHVKQYLPAPNGGAEISFHTVVSGLAELMLNDMIVWVLRDNRKARDFYERLGGVFVRSQPITIGSALLQEVSYGWKSLDAITY